MRHKIDPPRASREEPTITAQVEELERERDRAMIAEGFRVVRFTGQEVYRGEEDCAQEDAQLVG